MILKNIKKHFNHKKASLENFLEEVAGVSIWDFLGLIDETQEKPDTFYHFISKIRTQLNLDRGEIIPKMIVKTNLTVFLNQYFNAYHQDEWLIRSFVFDEDSGKYIKHDSFYDFYLENDWLEVNHIWTKYVEYMDSMGFCISIFANDHNIYSTSKKIVKKKTIKI